MKSLNSFIQQKRIKEQKVNYNLDEKTIFHIFSSVIKEEFGKQGNLNIKPCLLKNKIIFVNIKNSIWAQELWIQRNYFINNLNKKIGGKVIKDIKVSN
jgi:hypothetical protein